MKTNLLIATVALISAVTAQADFGDPNCTAEIRVSGYDISEIMEFKAAQNLQRKGYRIIRDAPSNLSPYVLDITYHVYSKIDYCVLKARFFRHDSDLNTDVMIAAKNVDVLPIVDLGASWQSSCYHALKKALAEIPTCKKLNH